jgi:hypothetical protein
MWVNLWATMPGQWTEDWLQVQQTNDLRIGVGCVSPPLPGYSADRTVLLSFSLGGELVAEVQLTEHQASQIGLALLERSRPVSQR